MSCDMIWYDTVRCYVMLHYLIGPYHSSIETNQVGLRGNYSLKKIKED